MAFVFNTGVTAAPALSPLLDRYLQLAHPVVPDVLQLQWMPDNGSYKPPRRTGQLQVTGRTATASLAVVRANVSKREWKDLAYVCTLPQLRLLEQLVQAQTSLSPCTLVDNTLLEYATYNAVVELAADYAVPYSGLNELLVQLSLYQV